MNCLPSQDLACERRYTSGYRLSSTTRSASTFTCKFLETKHIRRFLGPLNNWTRRTFLISLFQHHINKRNTRSTDYRRDNSFDLLKGWLSSNDKNLWKVKTTAKSCPNLLFLTLFYQEMNNIQLQQLQQEEATRIRLNQNVNKLEHQVQNLTTVSSVQSSPQHFSYGDEATW